MARLQVVLTAMREMVVVRLRQARCALVRSDFTRAAAELETLICEMPEARFGLRHDLAYAQFALGRFEDASHTLAPVREQDDDDDAVFVLKARMLYRQKQYAAAYEALVSVVHGNRLAEAHGLQALLLLEMGETTRAELMAAQALDIDQRQYEALLVRGTVALSHQNLEPATVTFEQVLMQHPSSGRALLWLGQARMLRGDLDHARGLLEHASAQMPDHIGTWHALAWCQLLVGDLAGAHHSFDRAFAIDRIFGETHGGLALVHALRGERQAAEEAIKRAMRLDPAGRTARYARSVLLDEGRTEEAQRVIDDIMQPTLGRPDSSPAVPADFVLWLRELVRPKG